MAAPRTPQAEPAVIEAFEPGPAPTPTERLQAEVEAEQVLELAVSPRERRRRALAVKVPLCGPDDDDGTQAYVQMIPPTKWGPDVWDDLNAAEWYDWAGQVLVGDGDQDTFARLQPDPDECRVAIAAAAEAVGGSLGDHRAARRSLRRAATR